MPESKGDKERAAQRSADSAKLPEDEAPGAFLPDLFRRALALGLSGIFTTEQAFRRALGDTLPRDWVDFALDQSERTRDEFVGRLASEIAAVLENIDLDEFARRVLAEHRVEVKAEIRLVPEEGAPSKRRRAAKVTVVGGGKPK